MPGYKISKVAAREVLDSRGNPTVEVVIVAGKGRNSICASAIVPSGASTGKHEALELRDNEKRFLGRGVSKAVSNVNSIISRKVIGMDCRNQHGLDSLMIGLDGTPDKSRLGANAILGVSLAAARAASAATNTPLHQVVGKISRNRRFVLPVPFCNVINGGRHAGTSLRLQEFMLVPVKAASFKDAVTMLSETYHTLKGIISTVYGKGAVNVGDEGGFAPDINSAEKALVLLEQAVGKAGYKGRIKFAIDAAASEFFNGSYYDVGKILQPSDLIDYYMGLIRSFPVVSLEDPFDQEDFGSFAELKKKSGIQIVADDLTVTNLNRIRTAVSRKSANCLLLKVNQVGTLSEAISAANLAFKSRWRVMVSHRSGETEDSFIADLSVSLGCGQIKAGSVARGERTSKYNQLLRLEEDYGLKLAKF
ncbi:phosphopyruvate hydratase [Candidatus Woesearchaeota archaeon]|nr:phosphopyruvate hydratase [Candidatus Woesearchaeota archaeon]